jgi:hypothetical protein
MISASIRGCSGSAEGAREVLQARGNFEEIKLEIAKKAFRVFLRRRTSHLLTIFGLIMFLALVLKSCDLGQFR